MKIYHNPRCSKSRQTLQLIEEKGVTPEICLYLETPPSVSELTAILKKLGKAPRDILRKGEQEYKDNNFADKGLSDSDLIDLMVKFPKVIERPIVVDGDKAVLGRPPENVLDLF